MTLAAAGLLSCTGTGQSAFDPASVADASVFIQKIQEQLHMKVKKLSSTVLVRRRTMVLSSYTRS